MTAGRWPRKSAPAKDRVTTHLPNRTAPKMDVAKSCTFRRAATASSTDSRSPVYAVVSSCVWRNGGVEGPFAREVVWSRTVGADLSDSSEGFDVGKRVCE